jgi:hypothetical protein
MGLTFEQVWASLQETDRIIQEMGRETDRKMQETDRRMQETDRKMQETDRKMQETDRRMQETDRRMQETDREIREMGRKADRELDRATKLVGDLSNKFGELSEYLIAPNMVAKFNTLGFTFTRDSRNIVYRGSDGKILTEVDVLLENGDVVMIVEIKSDLTEKHISHHLERMEKLRRYGDAHNDRRKLMGAVASPIMRADIKTLAYAAGFYVIEQSGDTVLIEKPEGFVPRQW